MRVLATAALVLLLGGCTRMDEELARVRAKISLRDLPPETASEQPTPPRDCVGAYDAHLDDGTHDLMRLGGVVFADLATGGAWRYASARAYARHLSRKDPAREEILDNGAELHVAHLAHVVVPGARAVTISVDEATNFAKVGLIPGGVGRFGGYSAADGEAVVRCHAGPLTTTFPLGVVVEGPRCASVTVELDGEAPESRLIAFGRKRCP